MLDFRYERVPDDLKVTFGLDAAAKTGISNDHSALCVLASSKTHHYLVEMIRRKVTYPNLKRMLIEAADTHKPSAIYIEDTSNATALIQELKAETRLPIVPRQAKSTKISRMEAQTGLLEAGRLLLPADRLAAVWLLDFQREMLSLPNGRWDDQADALFIALANVARHKPLFVTSAWGGPDPNNPDYSRPGPWLDLR
jgi:predicted phage terminase large subunit-like protein